MISLSEYGFYPVDYNNINFRIYLRQNIVDQLVPR